MMHPARTLLLLAAVSLFPVVDLHAQVPGGKPYLKAGETRRAEDFLDGAFRRRLDALTPEARQRALTRMEGFNIPGEDLPHLHLDQEGGVYYACSFRHAAGETEPAPAPAESPVVSAAAVPVSPFPASLLFHSRPGAPNVVFLDFDGATVSGTAWNSGGNTLQATPFSTDSANDFTTFSDAEQLAIKRIWMRVAEDFAPFNVDVTTEAPATLHNRVCHVLITRNTDLNGTFNPSSGAGGVAYVDVFGYSYYPTYRPAWVYSNNLGNSESNIAEAASHEAGHNFGLSHDTTVSNPDGYYGGHGSGDTSWGPIMGTGYGRNVSQWSKGEYTNANNLEDDLAILATDLGYRVDDAGNTAASPKPLAITNNTTLVVTSVDADPANANPANKGVLERNTDVDVWTFNSGTGTLNIRVDPFVNPAGTRGGNVDLLVDLTNAAGTLLGTYNPAANTHAVVNAPVSAGQHYLHVRNTGVGTPTAATPSGYTVYGSIGQYFISGTIPNNSGIVAPPQAASTPGNLTAAGVAAHPFTVTYSDDVAVDVASLDGGDIRVTGPNGYNRQASFTAVDVNENGTPRVATYAAPAPDGAAWVPADNGTYQVELLATQVRDTEGAFAAARVLGTFQVTVPMVLYSADMNANPGWTFTGPPPSNGWAYGVPAGAGGGAGGQPDPTAGYTGANVVGYNLNGNYGSNLATCYATTPAFDCSAAGTVTLQFRRWLGLRSGDTATVQVSANGTAWTTVWSTGSNYNETSWPLVTYDISVIAAGQPAVQVRWSLASNNSQNRCGWNIDDVLVLGGGVTPDTQPPSATLAGGAVTSPGGPSHSFTVTYADDEAVSVASLDGADLIVTAPGGALLPAAFSGVDENTDGTPRTATYTVSAPGGSWDAADNGNYTVALDADQVFDPTGNAAAPAALGSFSVNIVTYTLATAVTPAGAGTVTPNGGTYNAGTPVNVTAAANAGYRFTAWSGASTSANPSISVVMNANLSLTANFVENVAPVVTLSPVAGITLPKTAAHPLSVTCSDNVAVAVASLDGADIRVTGPGGFDAAAALAVAPAGGNGTPRTAEYALAAPGGAWGPEDNGTYTVRLQAGQVLDTAGNAAAAGVLGTFTVNIPVYTLTTYINPPGAGGVTPPGGTFAAGTSVEVSASASAGFRFTGWSGASASTNAALTLVMDANRELTANFTESVAPTATVSAAAITLTGGTNQLLVVSIADNVAVNAASLDGADLRVTGPGGFDAPAAFVRLTGPGDANPVAAEYLVAAPGGAWGPEDNGEYTVQAQAGQMLDTAGNAVAAGPIGSFAVNIATWMVTTAALPAEGGTVEGGGAYAAGAVATVVALPGPYHRLSGWSDEPELTNATRHVVVLTNLVLEARFAEILTEAHPTPLVWLAGNGYTNNFEAATAEIGANGMPVWQSYVAGLDPQDPDDTLRLEIPGVDVTGAHPVLAWSPVGGRVYTLLAATGAGGPFLPLDGATGLPASVATWTDTTHSADARVFYRIQVELAP